MKYENEALSTDNINLNFNLTASLMHRFFKKFFYIYYFTFIQLCLIKELYHSIFDAVSNSMKRIKATRGIFLKNPYLVWENPTPNK